MLMTIALLFRLFVLLSFRDCSFGLRVEFDFDSDF